MARLVVIFTFLILFQWPLLVLVYIEPNTETMMFNEQFHTKLEDVSLLLWQTTAF